MKTSASLNRLQSRRQAILRRIAILDEKIVKVELRLSRLGKLEKRPAA